MVYDKEIAVFGCGAWGRNLVRTLHQLGALRCVVDPSPSALERSRELAPGVPVFHDPERALADPAVRGVMVAVPAEHHYAAATGAIAAGKEVFVEKPLTVNLVEARDLVARAVAANRVLMVGHLLEYHPAILKLRELIEEGELGDVLYIASNRLNLGKIRTEENALWSFAPHDIAITLRLVGRMPREVVATGGCYVQPQIADVTLTQLLFENGVRSHIFVSWLHPFKEQKLVVVGSKRMASFDDVAKELVLYDQRVDWREGQPVPVRGEGVPVEFSTEEPLKQECVHFLECVGGRRRPRTDGFDGLRVLEILHAAQTSLTANGQPVRLRLDGEQRSALLREARPVASVPSPEPVVDVPVQS